MSSLRPVGRSAATLDKDRKSLCRFTFADGRQCRSPRSPHHPHFCSDHARKDSQACAADKLARELSYFFSGQYLSACDLSAALGRLLPAVVRAATLSPAPPAPSPISLKLLPKPSILPSTNTPTPSATTLGAGSSAIPSTKTSTTATPPRHPNRHWTRLRM